MREYTLQSFGEMADHFKSDYFNMPVHVRAMLSHGTLSLRSPHTYIHTYIRGVFCSHDRPAIVTDGSYRAGGERVLEAGKQHRGRRDSRVWCGYQLQRRRKRLSCPRWEKKTIRGRGGQLEFLILI